MTDLNEAKQSHALASAKLALRGRILTSRGLMNGGQRNAAGQRLRDRSEDVV